MVGILLRKQLAEMFRSYFYDAKKNAARSKGTTVMYILLFAVLMVGILGGLFTMLSLRLCEAMHAVGVDWLYFTIMGMSAVLLGAFGSVFNTYSGLYLAKDNALLLSMPIPVRAIMIARLLGVYLMGLMYSAVVILPAVIVYWIVVSAAPAVIAGSVLLVLLISIFVLTLSCALGWVVAKISLKLKHKSFVTVLVSLLFIGAYYFFYFRAQTMISDLLMNAVTYGDKIMQGAYPLYLFGCVATGNGLAMLLVSAVLLALFALVWWLLSRSFLRIATSTGTTEKRVYRERAAKQSGVSAALLRRELLHFTSSANYMLNCGLGVLFLAVGAVVVLLKGEQLVSLLDAVFGGRPGFTPLLLCTIVCMVAVMNDMTAPSISLEGRSLWLAQSLPVTPWQVLRAKLSMQLLLSGIPALLCLACMAAVYPFTAVEFVISVVVTLLVVSFSALLGLSLGLKMPNLTWTNEIMPIKQSMNVVIALVGGWLYVSLLFVGYLLAGWKLGFAVYVSAFAALTLALCAVLYAWLRKRGTAVFASL